jgi:hypothetical protein
MKNLEKLFEQYNFDYIVINPNDIDSIIEWEIIPEEIFADFTAPPDYIGTIKLKDKLIEVYSDKKITSGDVIFKYKTIRKERNIKLKKILK